MNNRLSHYVFGAVLAGAAFCAIGPSPAQAQTANSMLGSVITQVVSIFNSGNYNGNAANNSWQYSNSQANTVIGRTNYGGVVYADGRIVYDGQTYYSSNDGRTPCSYIANSAPRCTANARGYRIVQNAPHPQWDSQQRNWSNANRGNQNNNGRHNGEYKDHDNNGNNGNGKHNDRNDR